MPAHRKYPVTVVTGFLGSGKTTLINRLLKDEAMADTAVIINEFGSIPIDHLLVESAIENTLVLENGCICCTVRGDLVDTLASLHEKAGRGEIPAFSRVLVETTGLAEPAPIIGTLTGPAPGERFFLNAIVTTLDCINGAVQIDEHPQVAKQLAGAGLILLTKSDCCSGEAVEMTRALAQKLNPVAEIKSAGDADAALVLGARNWHLQAEKLDSWLPSRIATESLEPSGKNPTFLSRPGKGPGLFEAVHVQSVEAVSLTWDEPVRWLPVERWLRSLTSLRGDDIFRIKGLFNIEGLAGPRIVHGVQHLLHAPYDIPSWPDIDHRTRLVVICRDIPDESLRRSFRDSLRPTPASHAI